MLVHGPDTIQRFEEFSMSRLIDELQSYCPELYEPVQQLGRNARADTLPDEELKGNLHPSKCTICKGERFAADDKSDGGG